MILYAIMYVIRFDETAVSRLERTNFTLQIEECNSRSTSGKFDRGWLRKTQSNHRHCRRRRPRRRHLPHPPRRTHPVKTKMEVVATLAQRTVHFSSKCYLSYKMLLLSFVTSNPPSLPQDTKRRYMN